MNPLARIFGSAARLKLLRLFLFNEELSFSLSDAAFRVNLSKDIVRKELNVLIAADIVRKRSGKAGTVLTANRKFPHYEPLKTFLRTTTYVSDADMLATLKKAGSLRVVVLSGLFTGVIETKIDLLVVGDKLDERRLGKSIHELEAELGRELRFASFTTEDFKYRVGVYDRLVRDVFDYPHHTLMDKLGLQR